MAFACDFDAIPRGITSGGSVRFFPWVSGFSVPIVTYAWSFGDTGTSAVASPIHAYPAITVATSYTVTLTVTDAAGNTATKSRTAFIAGGVTVAAPPNDGKYQAISILIYDETNSMLVTRRPTALSNYYLMSPAVTNTIDKIGTATFSLLDIGNATTTERSLNASSKKVIIFAGKTPVFSGRIRRSTQNTQMGFDSTTRVQVWDVECDSDYAGLKKVNIAAAGLDASGNAIVDTPGNLARRILTPDTGEFGDARGVIGTVDTAIRYQLNTANNLQSAGDRYTHLETLRIQSNYDVRTRMDYLLYTFSTYAANVVTIVGTSLTTSELVGCWALFPLTTLASGAANNGEIKAYGRITANTGTTITIATLYGDTDIPATLDHILIARWPVVDFAHDLTEPSPVNTFQVNKTVFDYSDNDDQKKTVTKVVCQGKDLQGVTISVALAGCHAYDNDTQFFKDATYISRLSEGYVYQNTHTSDAVGVTVLLAGTTTFYANYPSYPTELVFNGSLNLAIGADVTFTTTGTLPAPLAVGTTYYVVEHLNAYYCKVSATRGGTAISTTNAGSGTHTINFATSGLKLSVANSGPLFSNNQYVTISADSVPTGLTAGAAYWVINAGINDYFLRLAYTGPGGTPTTITSAGSGVTLYSVNRIVNPISLNSTFPHVWLRGWGYGILTGTQMYLVSPSGTQVAITTTGTPSEVTMNDGTKCTRLQITKMLGNEGDFSGRGYCLSTKLWVNKASIVYTSGSVTLKVGEESLTVTASGTDTTYGPYLTVIGSTRIPSASLIAYPHGIGALVAKTNYTEASPEALSPIALYGILLETLVSDQNITYGDLDTYATLTLLGKSTFYPKATCWGPFNLVYVPRVGEFYAGLQQVSLAVPPRPGQNVYIQENTSVAAVEWQIVSVTIEYDKGTVTLTLGDFEKNVFTDLQAGTASLNFTVT